MNMTFHTDRRHFSTNLINSAGKSLVLFKMVADPAGEFDQCFSEFSQLKDLLGQRGNPIREAVSAISEAEYQRNFEHFIDRFTDLQNAELLELGVSPESTLGQVVLADSQRQVDFVKGLRGKSLDEIHELVNLIRIEVLQNGYMFIFGNVEHQVVAMAIFMNNNFERPTAEELQQAGLTELHMQQGAERDCARPTISVTRRSPAGASLH